MAFAVEWHHWLVGWHLVRASGAEHMGRKFGALCALVPADFTFLHWDIFLLFNFLLFRLTTGCLRSPLSLA